MKATVRTGAALFMCVAGAGLADAAEPVRAYGVSVAALAATGGPETADGLTTRASVTLQQGLLFESQVEVGFGLGVAAERDRSDRDPIGGRAGDCPPSNPACPSLGAAPLRSFASGITSFDARKRDAQISLEGAYLYLRQGWGEVSIGRDQGAARRLSVLPPTILAIGGGLEAPVDPLGGGVTLRNDIAGQSTKVVAQTTPILGLRAALSYTPDADFRGIDRGYSRRSGGPQVFEPEHVWEGGLAYAGAPGGWETEASLTYAQAEDHKRRPAFGAMEAWSAGASISRAGWSLGGAYLDNDNGWAAGGAHYRALGLSGVRDCDQWSFMLELGLASDDLVHVDQQTTGLSARRKLGNGLALAGGVSWASLASPVAGARGRVNDRKEGLGAFVEMSFGLSRG